MKKNNKSIKSWGLAIGLALGVIILVRMLVFQVLVINSDNMHATLKKGNWVVVGKLGTGARMPVSILGIPFTSIYSDLVQLPYMRIPGFSKVAVNDIIAYNYPLELDLPIDRKKVIISRCIGTPGDSVMVSHKVPRINGTMVEEKGKLTYRFRIVTDGTKLDRDFIQKYDIVSGGLVNDKGIYDFGLLPEHSEEVEKEEHIRNCRLTKEYPSDNSRSYFPGDSYHPWNRDFFGSLAIPYKGQTMYIGGRMFEIYKHLINNYEGHNAYLTEQGPFIDGKLTLNYTFKNNYYFVMDDNRDFGKDSRTWGMLPESHIIGKVHPLKIK